MTRKLASVQKILDIRPIEGADRIEVATVLGWECVVAKKDNFKVGDLVVYIEVDSILPPLPEYEFLKDRKYRVKTIRLRKQVSQGLIIPLTFNAKEGDDVTQKLGIVKYETPTDRATRLREEIEASKLKRFLMKNKWYRRIFMPKRGGFPNFIKKTDEDRIQLFPNICENKSKFVITEKLDGCISGRMLVHTNSGYKRIAEIVKTKSDVLVLSYNESTGVSEFKKILDYHKIKSNRVEYKIGVGFRGKGNRAKFIECTDNHKFLTNTGWKEAKDLNIDDKVFHYVDKISYEIEQLFLGCLLGDSSFTSDLAINFNHSVKQEDYFKYKKMLLGKLFIQQKDSISGYGSQIKRGITAANLSILNLINSFCMIEGKKKINKKWLDELSPISLAFWYMDDGSISNRDAKRQMPRAIINTQRYSLEEVEMFKFMFKTKFNIDISIGDKKTYKGYTILMDKDNSEKFFAIIAPYVCESMKYKLPEKYEKIQCIYEKETFDTNKSIIETDILSIEKLAPSTFGNYVFDLTIEDNKNYFANNILIHNCSATYFYIKGSEWWKFWEKGHFGVCSRNLYHRKPSTNNWWMVAKQFKIEESLKKMDFKKTIHIQGEILGQGIQGNKYGLSGFDFYVFNVFIDGRQLEDGDARTIASEMGLKFVPLLEQGMPLLNSIPEMVEYSRGQSVIANIKREGIVCRNYEQNISFKVINPDFLLKYEEEDKILHSK